MENSPWYKQTWVVTLAAPLLALLVAGGASWFFGIREGVRAAELKARKSYRQAQENRKMIQQMRENRQDFRERVLQSLSELHTKLDDDSRP